MPAASGAHKGRPYAPTSRRVGAALVAALVRNNKEGAHKGRPYGALRRYVRVRTRIWKLSKPSSATCIQA